MDDFNIKTGVTPVDKRVKGKYAPVFEAARKADGDWISFETTTHNVAHNIQIGGLTGCEAGEFEARGTEGIVYVRLSGGAHD